MDHCTCHSETHIRFSVMLHSCCAGAAAAATTTEGKAPAGVNDQARGLRLREAGLHAQARYPQGDPVRHGTRCMLDTEHITSPCLRCLIMWLSHQQGERGLQAVRLCGEGGYGSVMIVRDPGTGQLRAIKYQVRPLLLHSWVLVWRLEAHTTPPTSLPTLLSSRRRASSCVRGGSRVRSWRSSRIAASPRTTSGTSCLQLVSGGGGDGRLVRACALTSLSRTALSYPEEGGNVLNIGVIDMEGLQDSVNLYDWSCVKRGELKCQGAISSYHC